MVGHIGPNTAAVMPSPKLCNPIRGDLWRGAVTTRLAVRAAVLNAERNCSGDIHAKRPAASAAHHRPSDHQEPDHEHQPCRRDRRGRADHRALSTLSRAEGEGRHRADHVRRVEQCLRRQSELVPSASRQRGSLHPAPDRIRRAHPQTWLQADVPDHPSRAAQRELCGSLAARHRALARARDAASLVSARDGCE